MDVSHLLDQLNDAQREAVTADEGHVLVLAGAGSGKTRVLVHRIAWLIQVHHVSPMGLLAVTFTNKAAGEMRHRVGKLLNLRPDGLWIGTFHGICHRMLRMHAAEVGLPETFQILDSDDQYRLIRRVIRDMELDEGEFPARQMQGFINHHKEEGRRPGDIECFDHAFQARQLAIYQHYQDYCERSGLIDFAELLLRTLELLRDSDARRAHYQDRFGHILIDEFQDTNTLQYALVRLLAGSKNQLFVVGDDDQSIYGWRGAKVENVVHFDRDFSPKVVRLEQNYRSTATILEAANRVIDHNAERMGKNLWTEGEKGEALKLFTAFNAEEEAEFVIARIQDWMEQGGRASETAILYRSNAQSRLFEQVLLREEIPYRVYGGLRFFERAEVKDAMAYLRLVHNPHDDPAFERVINLPARGIGERTVALIRDHARRQGQSLFEAARSLCESGGFTARAGNAVAGFLALIGELTDEYGQAGLGEAMQAAIDRAELADWYRSREPADRAEAREENLAELVRAAESFTQPFEDEQAGLSPTASFLAQAALEAGEHQGERWQDCVQLMTLHSAKGLEFPLVFMAGMEEGLFPHQKSAEEPGRLAEERRLCYVGMTRAMQQLVLSHAESRMIHGQTNFSRPSRFLSEIPAELVEELRPGRPRVAPAQSHGGAPQDAEGLSLGTTVRHPRFGLGTVVTIEGQGANARIQINFESAGSKWLVLGYASLERVG
ncbi:DNA helicase II [Wenzhouxiangella marina]|uniref:DNA 3'-5' helicase n=1 Tax=Wenzhouxiangella marina TaxID=1579979 RepID=A0A0K0XS86_9GAMM|nr:DNA helicase II [Wenzhouxiangella marina]AKS40548.1 DNA-dependent ATPase I and helicase II [Wenzhouxiangella marina]MBB6088316.1 DNA helicase-2/ATP-dependent DNA helicase PcrA [Wenzhouxiangella marina]